MAAAAALQTVLPSGAAHKLLGTQAPLDRKPSYNELEKQQEKQRIADYSDSKGSLPPDQIKQDPAQKQLGQASHSLQLKDFDLLKTIGTGLPSPVDDVPLTSSYKNWW